MFYYYIYRAHVKNFRLWGKNKNWRKKESLQKKKPCKHAFHLKKKKSESFPFCRWYTTVWSLSRLILNITIERFGISSGSIVTSRAITSSTLFEAWHRSVPPPLPVVVCSHSPYGMTSGNASILFLPHVTKPTGEENEINYFLVQFQSREKSILIYPSCYLCPLLWIRQRHLQR